MELHLDVLDELRDRGLLRNPKSNPVGEYAEHLVAAACQLDLVESGREGYDAVDLEGKLYQVKGRRSRRGCKLPDLTNRPFDYLVGVLFTEDLTVERAFRIAIHDLLHIVGYGKRRRLSWGESLWALPGVEDITERIRAAAST